MNKSETISKLSVALVKAQAEFPAVIFDAENPFLHNKYATLGAVIAASRPVLVKYGLSITQFPINSINQVGITSILLHESGEYIESTIIMSVGEGKGKSLAQEVGSIITYLRRYSWASILGLYADEDIDANSTQMQEKVKEAREAGIEGHIWSEKQVSAIMEILPEVALDAIQASIVLDLSVLPQNATQKTVKSWVNHLKIGLDEGQAIIDAAASANIAYQNAVKK